MTWLVTWHDCMGSMAEAATPTGLWTFHTQQEAESFEILLETFRANHDLDVLILVKELPIAGRKSEMDLLTDFLKSNYQDELDAEQAEQAWEAQVVALGPGPQIVYEDIDKTLPPELAPLQAIGWTNERPNPYQPSRPQRTLFATPSKDLKDVGTGSPREVSLWFDGVRITGTDSTSMVQEWVAKIGSGAKIIQGTSSEDVIAQAEKARKEARKNRIEPLAADEIPDDVLASLGVPTLKEKDE